MNIRYRVTLATEKQQQLELLVRGGTGAVRMIKRAQILLAADAGSIDEEIAQNVVVGTSTVYAGAWPNVSGPPARPTARRAVARACAIGPVERFVTIIDGLPRCPAQLR